MTSKAEQNGACVQTEPCPKCHLWTAIWWNGSLHCIWCPAIFKPGDGQIEGKCDHPKLGRKVKPYCTGRHAVCPNCHIHTYDYDPCIGDVLALYEEIAKKKKQLSSL